jgi:pimeloyl-ACP methyl ester carboxylesterase
MHTHMLALAELSDQLGLEPAAVVAHSMGGLLALALAESRPDRVAALVLVNAGGVPLTPRRMAVLVRGFVAFDLVFGRPSVMRAVARRPRLRELLVRGFLSDPKALSGPFAAEIVPLMAAPGFSDAVAAAGRLVARSHIPAKLTCPVRVIWGANDRILPLAAARELVTRLPNASLDIIDRAGHCPMFEIPTEFNRAVLGFTASLDQGTE